MVEAILIAILLAKLKGYKLGVFFNEIAAYLILIFAGVYVVLEFMVFSGNYSYLRYAWIFKTTNIALFLILAFKHKQYLSAIAGSGCVLLGSFLNSIAISANGGKMPVFPSLSYITGYIKANTFQSANDGLHVLGNSATKYKLLTDVIDTGYSIMSVGDVIIRFLPFIVIYTVIRSISTKEMAVGEVKDG